MQRRAQVPDLALQIEDERGGVELDAKVAFQPSRFERALKIRAAESPVGRLRVGRRDRHDANIDELNHPLDAGPACMGEVVDLEQMRRVERNRSDGQRI